ncbi:asparaginase domain-containing protein [Sphingomonas sp. HF-S4]|uniref:Asparaginase domain-containing protein n=1 Tax=Sphingomonas agrestis TaxID=3080540 RepID=A0ABU3Y1X6_9SPHN|nr:asparaginase domain-containing protein [Sphingomonas sp. HF-S4]MDV3455372.1 asparaginase domain-containing protein [Sphingomonas sp. HF-S4]
MSSLVLVDAGGTIASLPDAQGVLVGRAGAAGLREVLAPAARAGVIERQAYAGLSEDMEFGDAMRIADLVSEAAAEGAAGVVVTHGTDTMEDVAFLIDLFHSGDMPVVFTGAQRAASLPGCDGPANLHDAVAVARDPAARGIGTVVVFGGRILPARSARKLDSSGPEAFGPHGTAIGRVDGHGVRLTATPRRAPVFEVADLEPAVEIAALGLGSSPALVDALVAAGVRGLVIEGFGRGNVPTPLVPAIERARAAGVLIGLATHCLEGGTAPAYETGAALAAIGAIGAEDLSARKLRLLLAVALGGGRSLVEAETRAREWLES